ncbi:MAG TPA: hypothetical protein VMU49_03975 [Candidatus Acidoferrales bacterium]|nr:hypothetical protein [Candidatus Acidoferrales bacterium]
MTNGQLRTSSEISALRFPPVAELGTLSLALVITGGIVMVSTMYPSPTLALPVALLVVSAALLITNIVLMSRVKVFNWQTFSLVGRWALLSYAISAGMIEFAFLHNHVGGSALVVLTLMLMMFMLNVPLIIGFTAARYQTRI